MLATAGGGDSCIDADWEYERLRRERAEHGDVYWRLVIDAGRQIDLSASHYRACARCFQWAWHNAGDVICLECVANLGKAEHGPNAASILDSIPQAEGAYS